MPWTITRWDSVLFSDVPNDTTVVMEFFVASGDPDSRWLHIGGTVSRDAGIPEKVYLRFELMDASGAPVWNREVTRDLAPGDVHVPIETAAAFVPALHPGTYRMRLGVFGSGVLFPDDCLYVVAIDLDDGPSPRVVETSMASSAGDAYTGEVALVSRALRSKEVVRRALGARPPGSARPRKPVRRRRKK